MCALAQYANAIDSPQHFHPSLIFASNGGAHPKVVPEVLHSVVDSPVLTRKNLMHIEMLV
jgi:hypothetical protein